MRIQVLPPDVAEKIAAGEVIQRPASVVKELLDNALDAGAARISVEIEQAGKTLIRVTDDGHGLAPEDLPIAFHHHATSKVSTAEDLDAISTMGFRGEALPSIAAVSDVSVVSRPHGAALGARIDVAFGEAGDCVEAGAPVGTTVEVRDLFKNLPARLKFLKSNRTEWGRIAGVVTQAAIAFPSVAFTLSHDRRQLLSSESHPSVRSRVERLFDATLAASLLQARARAAGMEVEGWISPPHVTRSNMNMVYVFVNSRYVRVPGAVRALKDAYGEYLPKGRHPVAFLFLTVPPGEIDVNVHPAKEEIRFRDGKAVYTIVRRAATEALAAADIASHTPAPGPPPGAFPERPRPPRAVAEPTVPFPSPKRAGPASRRPAPAAPAWGSAPAAPPLDFRLPPAVSRPFAAPRPAPGASNFLQVHNSYIVLEDREGILFIDQHALHERVLLEELKRKLAASTLERQKLLVPITVHLTPDEMARLDEIRDCLDETGISIEEFGPHTIAIRSVPALLGNADPADLVLEAVHHVAPGTDRDSTLRDLMGRMACRGAVKAGDRLSEEEIDRLLTMAQDTDFSTACAHGRPAQIRITLADLEKMFDRR